MMPAGLNIPRVLFNEIPVTGGVVPQVHMRVDDGQFGLNRDLGEASSSQSSSGAWVRLKSAGFAWRLMPVSFIGP